MFKLGPLWVIWIKIKEAYGIEQETGNGRDKEYPGGEIKEQDIQEALRQGERVMEGQWMGAGDKGWQERRST